jgi:putative addiction module CopG family antidote
MDITIPKSLEALVRRKVDEGHYSTEDEVVADALRLMQARDDVAEIKRARLRDAIEPGGRRHCSRQSDPTGEQRRDRRPLELTEIARADLKSIRRYSERTWGSDRTTQSRILVVRVLDDRMDYQRHLEAETGQDSDR